MASIVSPPFPVARFSVEQYHRLIASGAFTENDRLELLEGWVVEQMAKGPGHEYATGQIDQLLRAIVPDGWHVRNQAPVTLATSEPEPDVSIARGDRAAYRSRHPHADELALVVEVADTSLDTDRRKARTYGDAGIPVYWLVNLVDRCVEVHTSPGPGGYARCDVLRDGELELVVEGRPCGAIPLADLFP